MKEILKKYGGVRADRVWAAIGVASKGRFKKLIFDFVKDMEERMWEEWREEVREKEKWFLLGERKERVCGLNKRQRGLIGSVRLRVTNAMGDKGKGGGMCRLCGEKEETGVHWVAECSAFEKRRFGLVGVGGEGVETVWQSDEYMYRGKETSEFSGVDRLGNFFKLSVRMVDFRDSGERNEEFLDDLNLRSDVWGSVGSMEF